MWVQSRPSSFILNVSQGGEASPLSLHSSTAAPGSGRPVGSPAAVLPRGGQGHCWDVHEGAANGCHGALGDAGNESLGSLSERHCLDGIWVRMVSPLDEKKQTTEKLISAFGV